MWGPETSDADSAFVRKAARHFGKAYLYHNLAESCFTRVLTVDGVPAGIFCVSKVGSHGRKPFYDFMSAVNLVPLLCLKKFRAYVSGWKRYFHFCTVQENNLPNKFDAEVKLLFARDDFRGMGLGSKMLDEINKLLSEKGLSSFFLHTDTECDYTFYDKVGLTMLDKLSFPIPSDKGYTMYLYGTRSLKASSPTA